MSKMYEEHVRIDGSLRRRGIYGGGLDSLTLLLPESYRWRETHVGDGPFHYDPKDMFKAEITLELLGWHNDLLWLPRGATDRHPHIEGNVCIAYYKGTPDLPVVSFTPGPWLEAINRYDTAVYDRDQQGLEL